MEMPREKKDCIAWRSTLNIKGDREARMENFFLSLTTFYKPQEHVASEECFDLHKRVFNDILKNLHNTLSWV
jgi:hypothetical protein